MAAGTWISTSSGRTPLLVSCEPVARSIASFTYSSTAPLVVSKSSCARPFTESEPSTTLAGPWMITWVAGCTVRDLYPTVPAGITSG